MNLTRGSVAVLLALLVGVSCAPRERQSAQSGDPGRREPMTAPTSPASSDTIRLVSNTQATVGNVRIGAGNFRDDSYVNGLGESSNGPTAGLWVFVKDHPTQDRHLRVGAGSTFAAGRLSFEVLEVTNDTVQLRYSPSP
jgi:hypothetical protein